MTAYTEQALRAIIAMDPSIGQEAADTAIASLKGSGGADRRVLRPSEAADRLRVSTRTLRNWVRSGRIRAVSSGGDNPRAIGYDPESVDAAMGVYLDQAAKKRRVHVKQ